MPRRKRNQLKLFLCHAKEDANEVRTLYGVLAEAGFSVWMDEHDLVPGQEWRAAISERVRGCDIVLVCLSRRSVRKRGFVQKEIVCALDAADEQPEGATFIVPVLLEECSVPVRLSRWHWVRLFALDGYERLLSALNLRAVELRKEKGIAKRFPRPEGQMRYAKHGRVHIAYEIHGKGDRDILLIHGGFIPVQSMYGLPRFARFLGHLSTLGRLIVFDCRGIGCSDPIAKNQPPTVEQWAEDAYHVLKATGSSHTIVLGNDLGGAAAITLAVHHPSAVETMILFNAYARITRTNGYSFGQSPLEQRRQRSWVNDIWAGNGKSALKTLGPSVANDSRFVSWWRRATFGGASPGIARLFDDMVRRCDVRNILPSVRATTLVLHRRDNVYVKSAHGRYLAKHIQNARYAELMGKDHWIYAGNTEAILAQIRSFLQTPDRI